MGVGGDQAIFRSTEFHVRDKSNIVYKALAMQGTSDNRWKLALLVNIWMSDFCQTSCCTLEQASPDCGFVLCGCWAPASLLESTLTAPCLVAEWQHTGGLLTRAKYLWRSLFLSAWVLGLPSARYFSVFRSPLKYLLFQWLAPSIWRVLKYCPVSSAPVSHLSLLLGYDSHDSFSLGPHSYSKSLDLG